jgi:hypothetical protein
MVSFHSPNRGHLAVVASSVTAARPTVMLRRFLQIAPLGLLLLGHDARAATPSDTVDADAGELSSDVPAAKPRTWDRPKESFSLGMGATSHVIGRGFGFGLVGASPTVGRWFRLDASVGAEFFARPRDGAVGEDQQPYGDGRLLVEVSPDFRTGFPFRPYAAVGPELFLLPSSLSSRKVGVGAYGAVGLEIAFTNDDGTAAPVTLFGEVGGRFNTARADALASDSLIGSGMLVSVGIRTYL